MKRTPTTRLIRCCTVLVLAALQVPGVGLCAQTAAVESGTGQNTQKEAELAKKLQNPVASLVSVPIQNNWDFGIGPANAMKYTANIQPVVPLSISSNWNLIIRTIVPVIYQEAFNKQPVALQFGYRYYADKPNGGPDWGLRFACTFLFPI